MNSTDRVSVIITCYNHGHFVGEAIDSILQQDHQPIEIILVDDGSTDQTRLIAEQYRHQLKYVYQENAGLSAARNRGVDESTGSFLVFLDADDLLCAGAVSYNLGMLKGNSGARFVSGGYAFVREDRSPISDFFQPVHTDHYRRLLESNYIGMHATVMYRREVFDRFRFDEQLRCCEDYQLYLQVARDFTVLHHEAILALYRLHGNNMSGNYCNMLETVLSVLAKQNACIRNQAEAYSLSAGNCWFKNYYCGLMYIALKMNKTSQALSMMQCLRKYKPGLYVKALLHKIYRRAFRY